MSPKKFATLIEPAQLAAHQSPELVPTERKAPTAIPGLDGVLQGGFPRGRATIVTGGPGGGKTVLATQFLVNGALHFDEPGLLIPFEESPEALKGNFPGGWPEDELRRGAGIEFIDGRMPADAVEAGSFDLGGLIAIATALIGKSGIKRIAIDGIDALFALSDHPANQRREVLRLLRWLTEMRITALLTIKVGEGGAQLPDYYDLAEYAADGVIKLKPRSSASSPAARCRS